MSGVGIVSTAQESWTDVQPAESDIDWIADALSRRPTKRRTLTLAEYAETTIIPDGMYRGIEFRNDRSPFLVRPMQCMSPESHIQEVRCMFPAQTGKTMLGVLAAVYYSDEVPSEILYVGSDDRQVAKWFAKRYEPMARRKGVEFRAQELTAKSRRSGDTAVSKQFDGGNIDGGSSRSPSQLASETKRLVVSDEVDRWKLELGPEGLTWDIMHARTQAWGAQKKILAISTPTISGISVMEHLWEEGTQEEYLVPCPYCGHEQELYLDTGTGKGLSWKNTDRGIDWKSVIYLCESCGRGIQESKKHQMLNDGRWDARAVAKNPYIVSFHINAIYSPFKQWGEIAEQYNDTVGNAAKKQTFTNLVMGLPFVETGSRPKVENVLELRGAYSRGTVPDDVIWITAGIDVQRGSETNDANGPRLEMEVLGHGAGYRTWSIDYRVFYGDTADPNDGAWEDLREYIKDTGLIFSKRSGKKVPVSMVFIDSGDGERMDTVYHFCEPYPAIFPSKGFAALKQKKNEKGDEMTASNFKRYRYIKVSDSTLLYEISTNYYKRHVYNNLKIGRRDEYPQRPGFCEFPRDYEERYFAMLTAEEQRQDGSFHSGGRRNEALDCRVMALCAGEVFLEGLVANLRDAAKKRGADSVALSQIGYREAIAYLERIRG
jgi:phage terminase large subunit GpA-like protein